LPTTVFVGRDDALGAFRQLLQADASEGVPLVAFHGPAGIGKSTLLRTLYDGLQNVSPPVPHAWFNARNIVNHPQAYREVLMSWRITLQETFALRFPRFDLCFALLLAQENSGHGNTQSTANTDNNGSDSPFFTWLPSLRPTYELCQFLLEAPGQAGQIMREIHAAGKEGSGISASYWMQNGDDGQALINSLCCRVLSNQSSVIPELIGYFVADLRDSLWGRDSYAARAVLFFDSLEALWPGESPLLPELNLYVEWWLRELAALCMASGILLVIGTREALRWSETDADWEGARIEQHALSQLSPRESQEFLARCGIGPAHPEAPSSLQRAIMRSCSSLPSGGFLNQWTNRQVGDSLPLWLALCADIIQNFRRNGKGEPGAAQFALVQSSTPGKKLCDLLLKSLDDREAVRWLRELGLTPRCDEIAAQAIMSEASGNTLLLSHWNRFTQYSFVEDQGDGFWRIEPSLRQHLSESARRDDALAAHLNFFHHWTERGQTALAWFHQWAIEARQAVERWSTAFDAEWEANTPENIVRARDLLGWWGEIGLDESDLEHSGPKTWAKAHITLASALHDTPFRVRATALALSMAHYEAALAVFTSDEFPREWAETQIHIGTVQRALAREDACTEKQALIRAAIERYQTALRVATPTGAPREWGEIQMQLAGAHRDLLELDPSGGGPHDHLGRSIHFYEEAMRLWARARHPREWARIQVEMAATYAASPAGGRVRNLERALECYRSALEIFTEADAPRDWADVNAKMAGALMELPFGDRAENVRNAIAHYLSALRVYDEAATPFLWTQANLDVGLAWGELAYASDDLSAYRNAINYITTAGQSFGRLGRADEAARAEFIVQDINQSLQRAT
jgi:tetratricopeptide (TPR) repeat protein